MTYDIFIRFTDGSKIILSHVTEYKWDFENGCLKVAINNYWQRFNLNYVMYVGRVFDLGEEIISA